MEFFRNAFRRMTDGSARSGSVSRLILEARSDDLGRAQRAITALGQLPISPEALDCLIDLSGDATIGESARSAAAVAALGELGHPRAADRLLKIISSGSLSAKRAAEAMGRAHNNCAVPGLLDMALTHSSYLQVKLAIEDLTGIDTPDANSALGRFRSQPARTLSIDVLESTERTSSSALGQIPSKEELETVRSKLISLNVFRFGPREEMRSAVEDCLTQPEKARLAELHAFLVENDALASREAIERIAAAHFGDLMITRPAIASWIEAASQDAEARKAEIRTLLSSSDTSRLETYLLMKLESKFEQEQASGLLLLLPRLLQIGQFVDAFRSAILEDRTLCSILRILRKHVPSRFAALTMVYLRDQPGSTVSAEAARLVQGTDLEFLEPALLLLTDSRWAARMRAVEVLGSIHSETARSALLSQMKVEEDHEIRRAIENVIQPPIE
jgi:HEAT repeat protein